MTEAQQDGMQWESFLVSGLRSAKEAGDAILDVYHTAFSVELKEDRSPLTLADKRSHEIISRDIRSAAGALPLLSEEGKNIPHEERKRWGSFWLIDPLDGTKEFVKRNGEFTVNIALISGSVPVLGIIYAPVLGTFYYAARGLGAYRLDSASLSAAGSGDPDAAGPETLQSVLGKSRRLRPAGENGTGSEITVAGSRSHGSPEMEAFLKKLGERFTRVNLVAAGSSLKFCMVAEGSADIYLRQGPTMEWDTAAGQAIVEESGGAVVNLSNGSALEYNKESLLNPGFLVARGGLAGLLELAK